MCVGVAHVYMFPFYSQHAGTSCVLSPGLHTVKKPGPAGSPCLQSTLQELHACRVSGP